MLTLRQLESLEALASSRRGSSTRQLAGATFIREYSNLRVLTEDSCELFAGTYEYAFEARSGRAWQAPDSSWSLRVGEACLEGPWEPGTRTPNGAYERRAFDLDKLARDLVLRPVASGGSNSLAATRNREGS